MLDERSGGRLDRQEPDRAGPTPTPSNGTEGDPDEVPALTTRLEMVNGSRFSTFSVVLPSVRRAGLTVTNAPADRAVDRLGQGGTVEHGDRRIVAERDLAQRQPGVGAASTS